MTQALYAHMNNKRKKKQQKNKKKRKKEVRNKGHLIYNPICMKCPE
jgi:hypothetical protein